MDVLRALPNDRKIPVNVSRNFVIGFVISVGVIEFGTTVVIGKRYKDGRLRWRDTSFTVLKNFIAIVLDDKKNM